jgi:uncharacterized Zn-binding protein involved in type VI secretion
MQPIARLGDTHDCPVHGKNAIATGGSAIVDGLPVARIGDSCECGCKIVSGASQSTCDGKPVALIGSKTSKGGTIIAASPNHKTL